MAEITDDILRSEARARWIRITPRKMRLMADLVRGKRVTDAVNILGFTTKRAAGPIEKTVRSALANLMLLAGASKLDPSEAVVQEIRVDEGPTMKRWRARAMGRAYHIQKRTSHLTVVVTAQKPKVARKTKTTAKPKSEAPAEQTRE